MAHKRESTEALEHSNTKPLQITHNISTQEWRDFIAGHQQSSVFQSPEMYELFQHTDKFKPLVLAAHENGDLCGILMGVFIHERKGPCKLLSSRFVVYGGPLLSGDDTLQKKSLDALLRSLIKETRSKSLFIQFRNYFSQEKLIPVYKKFGFHLLDRLNYNIPI